MNFIRYLFHKLIFLCLEGLLNHKSLVMVLLPIFFFFPDGRTRFLLGDQVLNVHIFQIVLLSNANVHLLDELSA